MRWIARSTVVIASLAPSLAFGTTLHMQQLPNSSRFRCLNCHAVQDPSPAAARTLNPFGEAFRENGFRWDRGLASQRSDADNCTNGFELGDQDGDGTRDPGVTQERKNPGELDCTLQLDEAAWTTLKKLFR